MPASTSDWQPISQATSAPSPSPTASLPTASTPSPTPPSSSDGDWQPISSTNNATALPTAPTLPQENPFQTPASRIASGNGAENIDVAKGALKQGLSDVSSVGAQNTPMGKALITDLASKGNTFAQGVENFNSAVQPKNLPQAEGAADTSLGEMALPIDTAVKATGSAAESAGLVPRSLMAPEALKTSAVSDINKALSNTGKTSAAGLLSKDASRLSGAETLYDLVQGKPVVRPDGTTFTPDLTHISDPHDLLSAFVQAKNTVWSKVEAGLAKGSSIQPDYSTVASQLEDTVKNSADPQLVAHAQSRLASLDKLQSQGVNGAQRFLQQTLGPRIRTAVVGASDAPAVKMDVDIYNGISNALDEGLSQVKDANIAPYKAMYASLKSLEPDLVRTVQKTVRATGGGIPQYINDFANINLLEAAFAHNPALYLAKAGGMKILGYTLGKQRDALDHLSNAFRSIQAYKGAPAGLAETPTLALPPGVRGAPSQAGSGYKISLPSDAKPETNLRTYLPPLNQ